jgi:uncharacterized membrane protein YdjX (TVP38/TMEM64 family)
MNRKQWLLLAILAGAVAAFFAFGLHRYFTLAQIKAHQLQFSELFARNPLPVAGLFFVAYVAIAALSLPGAALLTLLAGAIFGVLWGTVIVSFASSVGATLSFLSSRYLLRDLVQRRFGARLGAINRGIERDGAFYLVTLRLVPVFPFFAVNLLMGLTPITTRTFYLASQIGMFLGTVIYVNVGTQLARLESLQGILSPALLVSLAALGLLPLAARAVVDALALKCKQALRQSGLKRLAVGGGVSANKRLRAKLAETCAKENAELVIPPLNLCTDNAAMAALAVEKWKLRQFAPPELDAEPNFT